jgi:hypothetical protein
VPDRRRGADDYRAALDEPQVAPVVFLLVPTGCFAFDEFGLGDGHFRPGEQFLGFTAKLGGLG